jgi:signal peptidase II
MKERSPSRLLRVSLFALSALLVLGLDLWSKEAVFRRLEVKTDGPPPRVVSQNVYEVIPNFFAFEANYNYGAFSGWFSAHPEGLAVLSAIALVVLAAVFIYQFRAMGCPGIVFTLSLGLLWGGTMGNLHDRALLGGVRDWIKWYYVSGGRERVWPNFNIADSAICTGVGLLILLEFRSYFRGRRESRREAKEMAAEV